MNAFTCNGVFLQHSIATFTWVNALNTSSTTGDLTQRQ